ncbi:conserved hypothetical protein (DUF262) [Alteracholeplasma palmae J233]|uniref:GmrSD restriction endonucleases N-terminal domain-containing protein n=1 Tax=Alteracholeplasma palmae (strain ATCC 49389 / J233) TaxID=1318466 RepID=U4KJM5_ALTPJ|nr:DUF262 domain-containing protein [Alteracholeplasma palmae]CCV63612.1 conserved hypothetical protein (DUF262) [Alteracholeplasma palmae J233]
MEFKTKKEFIESVLIGDPFGVLLLYSKLGSNKHSVIDGLQRFTTLKDFDKNPFAYITIDETNYPELLEIADKIVSYYNDQEISVILKEVKRCFSTVIRDKQDFINSNKFADRLIKELLRTYPGLENTPQYHQIYTKIILLWNNLEKVINLDSLEIPVILFTGDESELPSIFEKLNQGGTKLSKYEVFASSWDGTILKGVDREITKRVEARYKKIIEETELEIENYNEGSIKGEGKVTLYEYCLAMGKILTEELKDIFPSKKYDDSVIDTIGFASLITFLGMHLKNMNKLDKFINDKIKPSNLDNFKNLIIRSFKEVIAILKPYISIYSKYIEAQMLSIAYTWFKIHYELDIDTLEITNKKDTMNNLRLFTKYMPYRYLNDIIRSEWSGHGDNTLNEIINQDLNRNRYLIPIPEDTWQQNIKDWIETQSNKPLKTFTSDSKLFYLFATKKYRTNDEQKYIITHIIPKYVVEKIAGNISMSPVGNLYLLPEKDKAHKYDILYKAKRSVEGYEYPNKEQVQWVIDENYSLNKYEQFLEERNKFLINEFLKQL